MSACILLTSNHKLHTKSCDFLKERFPLAGDWSKLVMWSNMLRPKPRYVRRYFLVRSLWLTKQTNSRSTPRKIHAIRCLMFVCILLRSEAGKIEPFYLSRKQCNHKRDVADDFKDSWLDSRCCWARSISGIKIYAAVTLTPRIPSLYSHFPFLFIKPG